MNTLIKLCAILAITIFLQGCSTMGGTDMQVNTLLSASSTNTGCVSKKIHDNVVSSAGLEIDQCIESGNFQAVLAEIPKEEWESMFGMMTSGHHGAAYSKGKPYRVQWIWAGVTGDRNGVPIKIRRWVIIEGMSTFDPDAHVVIMDRKGNNAYDLHGKAVADFTAKDYQEGHWEKLNTLGDSTKLEFADAMFDGAHLPKLKQQVRQFATIGRVDFKDPSTGELFSIATPFNMTDAGMQSKMKTEAAKLNLDTLNDRMLYAVENFAISPSMYGMALSAAFVAWDFVTSPEYKPDQSDRASVILRVNEEYERFYKKLAEIDRAGM